MRSASNSVSSASITLPVLGVPLPPPSTMVHQPRRMQRQVANSRPRRYAAPKEVVPMGNPFVHVELHTNDVKRAREFYSKLFEWKLKDEPMPGGGAYTMIEVGTGTGGGMTINQAPGTDRKSTRLNSSHVSISY